jgi:beta-xylosidase
VTASSGFAVKRRGVHPKQAVAAVPGPVSGAVRLTARFAGKRAAYSWEYAEGDAAWSALPDTMQASTTIDALTPGRVYRFRARAHTSAGIGDWSDPVVFLAL